MTNESAEDLPDKSGLLGASDRIELIATIILAVATILTAWSAFQAGKWGGTQAINFSEAGAARTESTRADTSAGQLLQIDVAMYIDWVSALVEDADAEKIVLDNVTQYEPTRGTTSGFLFLRMREEFKPALQAWLDTDPINNESAPATPFEMDIYSLEKAEEAQRLTALSDAKSQAARDANQNGDNYVLTMVLFASVLFFAGVSSKLVNRWNRIIALGFSAFLLFVGLAILASLPILV